MLRWAAAIIFLKWAVCDAGFLAKPGTVVDSVAPASKLTEEETTHLQWHYLWPKAWPYVGDESWMSQFPKHSDKWYNSYAVFPHPQSNRLHGVLGLHPENRTAAWTPSAKPPPITDSNRDDRLKAGGGFYLDLSDSLPLDRDPEDNRPNVCKNEVYDLAELDDASVVITFFNEPMSTLLRTVHAVLNRTPPPLLREIILVDDHSNLTTLMPGGQLYAYVDLLPKVKILRLPERRGLVMARLAGAVVARAPVLVILDSHVEVNDKWLEPQLKQLKLSPEAIVAPQIAGINAETFDHQKYEGIGCRISFKWVMQEKSQGMIFPESPEAIPSASMAGGLFAVNRQWFWELGGYDEEFSMWGAENVEMPFRAWMCGGRVECAPCAITYHIYRKGGVGYKSPAESIWKNRLRTARVWTDELYQLTQTLIDHPTFDIGDLDTMLLLKRRLHCKNFKWYLDNVDDTQTLRTLDHIDLSGEIRHKRHRNRCIDTLSHHRDGEEWGTFHCHGEGGTQGFFRTSDDGFLRAFVDEGVCLGPDFKMHYCYADRKDTQWDVVDGSKLKNRGTETCLAYTTKVEMLPCDSKDQGALEWVFSKFKPNPNYEAPTISPAKLDWA